MICTDVYSKVQKYNKCLLYFDFVIVTFKNTVLSGSNDAEKIVPKYKLGELIPLGCRCIFFVHKTHTNIG